MKRPNGYQLVCFFFLLTFAAAIPAIVSGSIGRNAPGLTYNGALRATLGLRVSQEEECDGADLSIHKISATPE